MIPYPTPWVTTAASGLPTKSWAADCSTGMLKLPASSSAPVCPSRWGGPLPLGLDCSGLRIDGYLFPNREGWARPAGVRRPVAQADHPGQQRQGPEHLGAETRPLAGSRTHEQNGRPEEAPDMLGVSPSPA